MRRYQTPESTTGYLYDAMGSRVEKGSLSTFSCNVATNGFAPQHAFVYGPAGEVEAETDGSGTVQSSSLWVNGRLLGPIAFKITEKSPRWY